MSLTWPNCQPWQFPLFSDPRYPSLKLTLKVRNTKINFLDFNIANGRHVFDIYQRTSTVETSIYASPFCPSSHEIASLSFLVHRLTPYSSLGGRSRGMSSRSNISLKSTVLVKLNYCILMSATSLSSSSSLKKFKWILLPYFEKSFSVVLSTALKPYDLRASFDMFHVLCPAR